MSTAPSPPSAPNRASWPRRHRRALLLGGVLSLLLAALAAGVAASWHFSSSVVTPHRFSIAVPGELGAMPAWLIPGKRDVWAIVVHGINANRQDDLRIAPALHQAELPTLLITYREDAGAPPSPDGKHHMGLTEWRDLQSAALYALSHGAKKLVLVGYSMGGAIVTQFMERSPLSPRVAGLVLDAPALDWRAILSFNATELGLPSFAALPVEWMIGERVDADWTPHNQRDPSAAQGNNDVTGGSGVSLIDHQLRSFFALTSPSVLHETHILDMRLGSARRGLRDRERRVQTIMRRLIKRLGPGVEC